MGTSTDFSGNAAKALIRQIWDKPLLESAYQQVGHLLAYFGLPGPNVEDLLCWRSLLGLKTCVERFRPGKYRFEDQERIRRLLTNVSIHDLSNLQLLRGDIDDVILEAEDDDGTKPLLSRSINSRRIHWFYDVINLDYFGGVGGRGESKRARALKKLFERQEGANFTLLLTVNVRDKLDEELTSYLEQVRDRADGETYQIADWYANRQKKERGEKDVKLKAVVPSFITLTAEGHMFRCQTYPPITYEGTSHARMVHFVFSLTHVAGSLRAFSEQDMAHLLRLPLLQANSEGITLAPKQYPGFNITACFDLIPEHMRSIVS